MELVEIVYKVTAEFGPDERFGLVSQLRRAAVSVPSNIAEGNARRATLDYARFVAIAMGSVAELETQLEIAARVGLLNTKTKLQLLERYDEVGKMLLSLERKLRTRAATQVRDSAEYVSADGVRQSP
jgi:four helix bundle protein